MRQLDSMAEVTVLPPDSTSVDLQNAINGASYGDIIRLSGDMTFSSTITIPYLIEIILESDSGETWVMTQTNVNTRHFEIEGSLVLQNIILDGANQGGGIQLNRGNITTLEGSVIRNCTAEFGGAIQMAGGVYNMSGGTLQNNTATQGGGVYVGRGTFFMSGTGIIESNTATQDGGGIYVAAAYAFIMVGGDIRKNKAVNGGGMYLCTGPREEMKVDRGTFSENQALLHGGAVYLTDAATLETTDILLTGNRALAGDGGAIYTESAIYANLKTGTQTRFEGNQSAAAYYPPEGAETLYPQIKFGFAGLADHALNNDDINSRAGERYY